MRSVIALVTLIQAVLGARVLLRFLATSQGSRIRKAARTPEHAGAITVILPVLNEAHRVQPALDGLQAQGEEIREILVVDGGSHDGTQALVEEAAAADPRVRLVDASPVPAGVNGKAWGLQVGLDHARPDTGWILTIDADVRLQPALARSLLSHAEQEDVPVLSAATLQSISSLALGLVHPSMLATLVYRFGIPGSVTTTVSQIQANGQCFLIRRDVLAAIGGFAGVLGSVCEDVTLARKAAAAGYSVGFHETEHLVSAEMYAGAADAWRNWSRSLPMRDALTRRSSIIGLAEVFAAQAVPLWLLPVSLRTQGARHPWTIVNAALVMARFGVLVGMSRAYVTRPWTYALSPLIDLPVALQISRMAVRRKHVWRGREFSPGVSQ